MEGKVQEAVKLIQVLKDKNQRLAADFTKLEQERDLLDVENQQVRKLIVELDKLRAERTLIKQKCEALLAKFKKANL